MLITAYPSGAEIGDRFDIIDQQGYLGRATVTRIEKLGAGCPGLVFPQAHGRMDTIPSRQVYGNVAAVTATASAPPSRSRILLANEIRSQPNVRNQMLDMGVDLDGDRDADLVRYYYDCPTNGVGQIATCIDVWIRVRSSWKVLEKAVFPACY